MPFSVKFNGYELSEYLSVLADFERGIGSVRNIELKKIGLDRGKDFVSATQDEATISMPFALKHHLNEKRRILAEILNVTEPKELIFGDEPDKVYYAIPSGDIKISEKAFLGTGTIDWIIPDGVAHAKTTKVFTADLTSEGVLETTIINQGNAPATVSFEIENTSDNGYIGIVSDQGVMQFGNIEEADGEIATKSVQLANNKKGDFSDWTDGTIFYENSSKKAVTKMTADTQYGGRLGLLPAEFVNTENSDFFGAIKEKEFSETAKDWYLWAQTWFETGKMGQTGMWTLAIIGEEGETIAAYILRKADTVGNTAQCYFVLNGKIVKTINFTPSYWVKDNPYGSEARDSSCNPFDIRKEGDKVTFFWYGQYYPFTDPEIENLEATRLQFFVGQFKNRNTTINQKVSRMYINNLSFKKNNVKYWRDVPNKFSNGDKLLVDGDKKLAYVNGMLALDTEVRGTTYFKVPAGESKIQFYVSDFSNLPNIKTMVREVWS